MRQVATIETSKDRVFDIRIVNVKSDGYEISIDIMFLRDV